VAFCTKLIDDEDDDETETAEQRHDGFDVEKRVGS